MVDVITIGETMLRLNPPHEQLIEQTATFDLFVGGSESNVAVGMAKLGQNVQWISRLTDNPLGIRIANAIRAHGVDVSRVVWTPEDRVGIYYVEEGPAPRGKRVIYDRAGSAMSKMQPHDLPDDLFDSAQPGWLHLSGITLALSSSAASTAISAMEAAKSVGWQVSFDVNYRSMLWSAEQSVTGCEPMMDQSDLIIITLRDAVQLYNTSATYENALTSLQSRFPHATIVITLSADGACCIDPDGKVYHQSAFPAGGSGRIGGGDAFAAGFLSAYLENGVLGDALLWGNAAAAYKYTIRGDIPLLDRAALQSIIEGNAIHTVRR